MKTTIKYVLLTAMRDWLFYTIYGLIFICFGISVLFGGAGLAEEIQTMMAFASGSMRLVIALGLIVFVSFHVRRGFETKEIDVILTKPISRLSFLISYFLGLAITAFIVVLPAVLLMLYIGKAVNLSLILWSSSILVEALVVTAITLCISLISKSSVFSVLGAFSFYIMARMIGYMTFFLDAKAGMLPLKQQIAAYLIKTASVITPRLDLFAQSEWLVYPVGISDFYTQMQLIGTHLVVFIPLILALAYYDLQRKQF